MLLNIEGKVGIHYVLPTKVNLENLDVLEINFRVNKPFYNSYLKVNLNGELLKRYKKAFMLPGEMETIRIKKEELKVGTLSLEVEDA